MIRVLAGNSLSGSIPTELGLLSSRLEFLGVLFNSFTGSLPSELALLTSIQELSFRKNQLSGTIPVELFQADYTNLELLDFSANHFHGTIPSDVGLLSTIKYLYIKELPSLTGTIPTEIGRLSTLERIHLHQTSLEGSIPTEFCKLRKESHIQTVKVDCSSTVDGDSPPVFCPLGCCSKCCNRETGFCQDMYGRK